MTFLIQSNAGSVHAYLQSPSGSAVTGLISTDVTVDLKKAGETAFSNKTLDPIVDATATIGSGANGTVTVSVPGTAGNSWTVEVVSPAGTSPLSVSVSGTDITVNLSVSGGTPVTADNTATLVAAAIAAAHVDVSATASGTGADSLSSAEGPTSLTGGSDGDFNDLGGGFYEIDLDTTDTDVLGTLLVRITGTTIQSVVVGATVVAQAVTSPPTGLSIPTVLLSGYIRNPDNSPAINSTVQAKILSQPTILKPNEDSLAVTNARVVEKTDSNGFFAIELISGSTVDISIPAVNFRRTLVVPSISQNLFTIP